MSCTGLLGEEPPGAEELLTSNEDRTPLGSSRVGGIEDVADEVEGCVGGACSCMSTPGLGSTFLLFKRGWEACVLIRSLSDANDVRISTFRGGSLEVESI